MWLCAVTQAVAPIAFVTPHKEARGVRSVLRQGRCFLSCKVAKSSTVCRSHRDERDFSQVVTAGVMCLLLTQPCAADTNAAVLERLSKYKSSGEVEASRLVRLKVTMVGDLHGSCVHASLQPLLSSSSATQAAREQLSRVERLALAGEYTYAREQLRLGPLSNLNKDLRGSTTGLGGPSEEQGMAAKSSLLVRAWAAGGACDGDHATE